MTLNIWRDPKYAFEAGNKNLKNWQISFSASSKTDWKNDGKRVFSGLCTSLLFYWDLFHTRLNSYDKPWSYKKILSSLHILFFPIFLKYSIICFIFFIHQKYQKSCFYLVCMHEIFSAGMFSRMRDKQRWSIYYNQ